MLLPTSRLGQDIGSSGNGLHEKHIADLRINNINKK